MPIYNLFLKILRSKIGQLITYIVIFLCITMIFLAKVASPSESEYKNIKLTVALCDKDCTTESKLLSKYIKENTESYNIKSFKEETIQDDLFFRSVDAVVIIPKGFSEDFIKKNGNNCIDTYSISNTMTSNMMKDLINRYLSTALAYSTQGHSLSESLSYAEKISKIHAEVNLVSKKTSTFTMRYYFFSYLGYIFICTAFICGISILKVLNTRKLAARIQCSSYHFSKKNFEIFLGIATLGLIIYSVFAILSFIIIGQSIFTINGALFFLNAFGYMVMTLSLAYFFGQIIKKDVYISAVTNIVALFFSFLGGIFIPINYLGENVLKISHFLPSFWYIKGCEFAENYSNGSIIQTFHYIGIELIYAFVFYLAAVTVIRMRYKDEL